MSPLAVVEMLDRDGRVRQVMPVTQWPLDLGRALDNDIVLDDPHVAAYHARLEGPAAAAALAAMAMPAAGDTQPRLETDTQPPGQVPTVKLLLLPSLNGARLGRRRLAAGTRERLVPLAGEPIEFTLGTTRLRLRLAGEALAAEVPLPRPDAHRLTLALAALLWLWLLAGHAIETDPGGKVTEWLPPLLGLPLALVVWCLLWGLASKLFQQRLDFWPHFAVVVPWLLAIEAVGWILPWLAAVTNVAFFSRIQTAAVAALAVALVVAHARLVLPNHRRVLAALALAGFAGGLAIVGALNQQRLGRWFGELYTATLVPPALLWRGPVPAQEFLGRMDALQPRLERALRDAAAEARQGAEGEDD